jgi:hypothetical protein
MHQAKLDNVSHETRLFGKLGNSVWNTCEMKGSPSSRQKMVISRAFTTTDSVRLRKENTQDYRVCLPMVNVDPANMPRCLLKYIVNCSIS